MFLVKVPGINGRTYTSGCRNSGNSLIKELRKIQRNEQGKIIDINLLDIEEIHVDNSNLKESDELIFKNSLNFIENYGKTIFLGGDHSISYSIGKSFLESSKESENEKCLIVFDALPNCLNDSKNEFPDNENWLRKLIEFGFPKENILMVGVRNYSLKEMDFLKENNIKAISMNQFTEDIQETCDFVTEFCNGKDTYVSIDVSVLDPSFAPSTTHQESGGFTSREIIYLIQRINKIKNLKVVDIVEIDEIKDMKNNNLTLNVGAKILSELL